jgi:prophage antirepressor-like protein
VPTVDGYHLAVASMEKPVAQAFAAWVAGLIQPV